MTAKPSDPTAAQGGTSDISGPITANQVQQAAKDLLCDSVTQEHRVVTPMPPPLNGMNFWRVEVWLKPSVTDPVGETVRDVYRARGLLRPSLTIRWAWLLEGAARWFSGETRYARAAIGRRLRESGRPSFPPGLRDAPLLGGTVIDMLTREQGEQAAAELASRLHPQGPAGSSGTGIRRTSDGAHRGRVAYGSGPAGRRGAVDHL